MKRQSGDVISELLSFDGKKILDIGCGDGSLVRRMTIKGAHVTGLECGHLQLEKAYGTDKAGDENYVEGVGENLPMEDNTFDIVVFFNSLHHIPVNNQAKALMEAARVLKPGGQVYISEPVAEGTHFELNKPVDDESIVRKAALSALKDTASHGLTEQQELTYIHRAVHDSYATYRERMIRILPERKTYFDAHDEAHQKSFESFAVKTPDGYAFDQPVRVNLFTKQGLNPKR